MDTRVQGGEREKVCEKGERERPKNKKGRESTTEFPSYNRRHMRKPNSLVARGIESRGSRNVHEGLIAQSTADENEAVASRG